MNRLQFLKTALAGSASLVTLVQPSAAKVFDIPGGDLSTALGAYVQQSNAQIIYIKDIVRGHISRGARGDYTETAALTQLLRGTGFTTMATSSNAIEIVPAAREAKPRAEAMRVAAAAPRAPMEGAVETVVVTAQKKSENIQNVPIAVTALSQAQLTERQIAGGPDLVKEVPNLTFSKTNFTGYNIQIRGIGTQAISVTTDPAVAVAFNGTPFIRNHFFEQEFYDLQDVEVLRGPQGTLYGRNATAGVVNVKSAMPTDQFEAMASADIGNFSNRRLEGMINLPIVGDKVDLRVAGEWTRRDGYSFNQITNSPIDGRDLWSSRVTLGFRPIEGLQTNLIWEHFQEDDDRLRSSKQLCKKDLGPSEVDGIPVPGITAQPGGAFSNDAGYLSQGCAPVSLYSPEAFEVPNGFSLPYILALGASGQINAQDPYLSETQSRNLRVIESTIPPQYRAKNDTVELNADFTVTPALTLTSQTGFNRDFLYSTEDYNRFNTSPDMWGAQNNSYRPGLVEANGDFCDPQLGCTSRLVGEDLSTETAWQFSQEFRLSSEFKGPLNFSIGGNYLHYETDENYYVFINALTMLGAVPAFIPGGGNFTWIPNVTDNLQYLNGHKRPDPFAGTHSALPVSYIDPNPLASINGQGHNYFRSDNPYVLNSYATFGEAYYNILQDLKLTGGLRWTEDRKRFIRIPSEVLIEGYGYPSTGALDQQWDQLTGRFAANWTPQLDFTDQTLVYASYAHGYKAGGANPPGAVLMNGRVGGIANPIHPLTFKPEFIDAYELGSKNTMFDGTVTLNGDIFFYDYKGYQISRIVDRTAINDNFNAHVRGSELEATWEAVPGLKFGFAGGYEDARAAKGSESVDLMDRADAANHPDWMVIKPFATQASNCVLPDYVVREAILQPSNSQYDTVSLMCVYAYADHNDPITRLPYSYPFATPPSSDPYVNYSGAVSDGYIGFDPLAGTPGDPYTGQNTFGGHDYGPVPNNGAGFDKNVSGNQLPNAPHFTASLTAEYTIPVSDNWAATLHSDFYWQSQSWARIFNDRPYDKIRGYSNLNLALILTSADGWQVMGYLKNVFDTTAITGDFLNSDDSGLTTNVFLTDPRLFGVRVTKNFGEGDSGAMADVENYIADLFADKDNGRPPLWIELGGQLSRLGGQNVPFVPPFAIQAEQHGLLALAPLEAQPRYSIDENASISLEPEESDWIVSASIRFGRSGAGKHRYRQLEPQIYHIGAYASQYPHRPNDAGGPAVPLADYSTEEIEKHVILDFQAGKDVGLGLLGDKSVSHLAFGVRIGQLDSNSSLRLYADPNPHLSGLYYFAPFRIHLYSNQYDQYYKATPDISRSFRGVGPSLSWSGSIPMFDLGDESDIAFDWGVNAALLFGRQKAHIQHRTSGTEWYVHAFPTGSQQKYGTQHYVHNAKVDRSRSVTVPNLGGLVGVSWKYQNAKISFGYRADEFFGAMDGGIDTYKSENRDFFGPYANVSIGLGG